MHDAHAQRHTARGTPQSNDHAMMRRSARALCGAGKGVSRTQRRFGSAVASQLAESVDRRTLRQVVLTGVLTGVLPLSAARRGRPRRRAVQDSPPSRALRQVSLALRCSRAHSVGRRRSMRTERRVGVASHRTCDNGARAALLAGRAMAGGRGVLVVLMAGGPDLLPDSVGRSCGLPRHSRLGGAPAVQPRVRHLRREHRRGRALGALEAMAAVAAHSNAD